MKGFGKSLVLICSLPLIICFTVFSQNKSDSIKFDEYSEESGANLKLLAEKTKRFAKHLRKLPKTTKGVIIYYSSIKEKIDFCEEKRNIADERNDYIRDLLIKKYKISPARVISKDGNLSNDTEIDFWVQPNGAESPEVDFRMAVDCFCPVITIDGNEYTYNKIKPLIFTAKISSGSDEINFKWTVSSGEIIEGQGTPEIKVDISKTNAAQITADFEIEAACCGICINKASFTTKIYDQ